MADLLEFLCCLGLFSLFFVALLYFVSRRSGSSNSARSLFDKSRFSGARYAKHRGKMVIMTPGCVRVQSGIISWNADTQSVFHQLDNTLHQLVQHGPIMPKPYFLSESPDNLPVIEKFWKRNTQRKIVWPFPQQFVDVGVYLYCSPQEGTVRLLYQNNEAIAEQSFEVPTEQFVGQAAVMINQFLELLLVGKPN